MSSKLRLTAQTPNIAQQQIQRVTQTKWQPLNYIPPWGPASGALPGRITLDPLGFVVIEGLVVSTASYTPGQVTKIAILPVSWAAPLSTMAYPTGITAGHDTIRLVPANDGSIPVPYPTIQWTNQLGVIAVTPQVSLTGIRFAPFL